MLGTLDDLIDDGTIAMRVRGIDGTGARRDRCGPVISAVR